MNEHIHPPDEETAVTVSPRVPQSIYSDPSLARAAERTVWAMWQPALTSLLLGIPDASLQPEAAVRRGPKSGAVQVITVHGPISKRDSIWARLFGIEEASVESIGRRLSEAVSDSTVSTIVLDIDSPGGTADGVMGLADQIAAATESKHVVAYGNGLVASAAYWLASAADEVVVAPDTLVGSVGVLIQHVEFSEQLANEGVKVQFITAGKNKVATNAYEPLSEEGRAELQDIVDKTYDQFVSGVAKGRGADKSAVRGEQFGEGRVFMAADAKKRGMVDRVATLDATMSRLTGKRGKGVAASATIADEGAATRRSFVPRNHRWRLPTEPAADDKEKGTDNG